MSRRLKRGLNAGNPPYYFGNIGHRWRNELRQARQRVVVLSPYITSPLAELVLGCALPNICEIYTVLSVETFVVGASSIDTLIELQKRGYSLYELEGLHAKIVIVDESFASIGSQNLTQKGKSNLEASVAISEPGLVTEIANGIQPWLLGSRPITRQILADIEEKVIECAELYKAARREMTRFEKLARESIRQQIRNSWAEKARDAMGDLVPEGEVSIETARQFIRSSAWVLNQRTETGDSYAPNLARRVSGPYGDSRLELGNVFLVSRAIQKCARTIELYISDVVSGRPWKAEALHDRLRFDIRSSVTKHNGEKYDLYSFDGRFMRFGFFGIYVDHFIDVFLGRLSLDAIPS